jgi:hypothetical protein
MPQSDTGEQLEGRFEDVASGKAVPLHPEAAAFADQYGFTIDVLADVTLKASVIHERLVAEHGFTGRCAVLLFKMGREFIDGGPPQTGLPGCGGGRFTGQRDRVHQ